MNPRPSIGPPLRRLLLAALCLVGSRGRSQTLFYATSSATQGSNTVESVASSVNHSLFTATGLAPGSNGVVRCTAIAVDPVAQKVFLADAIGQKIWSLNEDGSGLASIVSIPISTLTDLTLDTAHQLIYFATSSSAQGSNTIESVTYTGANRSVLFTAGGSSGNGVSRCTSLALDSLHSKIIFSDAGSNALWSLPSAGGSPTAIVSNLTAAPLDVALDISNQLVYYVTSSTIQSNNTVRRIAYDGSSNTLLFTATGSANGSVQRCTALDFDPVDAKLYLADAGASALWSLNANGSGLASVESSVLPTPRRLKLLRAVSASTKPTITCPTDVTTNYNFAECGQSVAFAPVVAGTPAPVVTCTWNGVVIESPFLFPVGTSTVTCTASNSAGTDQCTFHVTVIDTALPVPGAFAMGPTENSPESVAVAKMLLVDQSPSGGTLRIASVTSPTAAAGTVMLAGGLLTYTPASNFVGSDTIHYILSDGCGTVPGTVSVTVTSSNAIPQNGMTIQTSGANALLQFRGIPAQSYYIQISSPTMTGPWTDLPGSPVKADSLGLIHLTATNPPSPSFYRTSTSQ
jgi:Cadherin-like domain